MVEVCMTLPEYIRGEYNEILYGDNPWFAGIKLCHPPSREECFLHYEANGGPEAYAKRHRHALSKDSESGDEPAHEFFKHPPPN